jgi:hypothetical protein
LAEGTQGQPPSGVALEHARRLFDNCIDWYRSADAKAQVLLSLDGAFLAFLTGSVFGRSGDAALVVRRFGVDTWTFLGVMCAAMTVSIFSAIRCLWSRTYSQHELKEKIAKAAPDDKDGYPPQVTWFFQFVHQLDPDTFTRQLLKVDEPYAIRVLASQIVELSRTVLEKHSWINLGFTSAAISLIAFVAALVSYVVRLR